VQIRQATGDDLDLLTHLRVAFLADVHRLDPAGVDAGFTDETRAFLTSSFQAGELWSWVAEEDRRAVGVVSVLLVAVPPRIQDRRSREGYIINMYVEPGSRRRGVGDALFRTCLASAGELGLRRFFLKATDDGRPLYARSGFAPTDGWLDLPVPHPS
jgi:ribosomal protein S18 acetylase RimI-like enzyme